MDKQTLGNTDLQTAPIVFGGNVFGWTLNEQESFDMLDKVFEAGFNTIDTSSSYSHWVEGNSGGESETIIGKWMKSRGNRNEVNIITKVGSNPAGDDRDLSKEHILHTAEESLKRLQVDQIDLYLSHWDDEITPVEKTLEAYQQLMDAGKVKHIGASNLSPERLRKSLEASDQRGLPRYKVLQPEYNLYDRKGFEDDYASICRGENLGVITYYSLASGFLTGKYRGKNDLNKSARGGGVEKYLNERGQRILSALDSVSQKHEVSQAGVALAWIINRPDVTAPIASATKARHLQSFTEAARLDLDDSDINRLDEASA